MAAKTMDERTILAELHHVPQERWQEVLAFIQCLQSANSLPTGSKPSMTADDLLRSGLIGMWADRTDIGDSREFARRLREQAQSRRREP